MMRKGCIDTRIPAFRLLPGYGLNKHFKQPEKFQKQCH